MQPTRFGGSSAPQPLPTQTVADVGLPRYLADAVPKPVGSSMTLVLPPSFPVVFTEQKRRQIEAEVKKFDLDKASMQDVALLGSDVEKQLHQVLDGFLAKVTQADQPRVFKLVERLKDEVNKEDLGGLADKILNAQPSFVDKLIGKFSARSLANASNNAFENVKLLATGKTKALTDVITKMERDLQGEMVRLEGEVKSMEQLKSAYVDRFMDFAYLTAYLIGIQQRAKAVLEQLEAQSQADPTYLNDYRAKYQALESRALAAEGTMTKLPSDQLKIRQLQNAGVQTLMETATTASSRFASIKMTLISINGALIVQGVQRLSLAGRSLDEALQGIDRKLVNEVVTSASSAPGDNRLAQAQQLQQVVADTKALQLIIDQARVKNTAQFEQARQIYTQARADMQQLGQVIRPDQQVTYR